MPWIGIAIVLVPLVVLFWTERQWVTAEKKFTAVALSIEPIAAGVHCQRLGESFVSSGSDLGHVDFEDGIPSGPAVLSYQTCNDLAAYWRSSVAREGHAADRAGHRGARAHPRVGPPHRDR